MNTPIEQGEQGWLRCNHLWLPVRDVKAKGWKGNDLFSVCKHDCGAIKELITGEVRWAQYRVDALEADLDRLRRELFIVRDGLGDAIADVERLESENEALRTRAEQAEAERDDYKGRTEAEFWRNQSLDEQLSEVGIRLTQAEAKAALADEMSDADQIIADHAAARVLEDAVRLLRVMANYSPAYQIRGEEVFTTAMRFANMARDFFAAHPEVDHD